MTTVSIGQAQLELREVNKLSEALNTSAEESLPVISPDGRLYFVRTLFDDNKGGKFAGQDIWYSLKESNDFKGASNDIHPLNTKFNNAVIGVADSGRTLYLNGTYSSKPEYQTGVSVSYWKNGKWTRPKRLRIKGFNPHSPYLTYYVNGDIGVMLLSYSKRSNPENEDLYVSFLHKNRVWSKPEPLGPQINTDKAEFSPFIENDGKTLFFSSDGHPGKGSADVFTAYRLDDTWQNWTSVTNMGEPINSSGFDAYYTRMGQEAFFASNREGMGLADIYKADYDVVIKQPIKDDPLKDAMTKENLFALEGFLDIKDPGRVGMVRVLTPEGNVVQRAKPNDDGSFLISGLDMYSKYSLDLDGQEKEIENLKIFFVNQDGSRVYLNEGIIDGSYPFETLEKDIRAVLMAEVSDDTDLDVTQFNFSDEMEIPAGSSIYLYDEYGNKQETSVVNRQGDFEFNTMRIGMIYRLELEEGTLDMNSKLFMYSDGEEHEVAGPILKGALFKKLNGQLIALDPESEEAKFAYARLNGEDVDVDASEFADTEELDAATFGFDYGELPPEGTKVNLVDEDGNIVDEAYTDENGLFKFTKLSADKKYSIKMDDVEDINRDLSMYIVDDDGLRVPVSQDIAGGKKFEGALAKSTQATEDMEIFTFNYRALPPAGSKVYLTDENNNIVDSAFVDADGKFKFKKLASDQAYKMRLSDEVDNSYGFDYTIMNSKGVLKKLGYEDVDGDFINSEDAGMAEYDKFSFDYSNLPKDGSMVYLTDQNGNVVDSSFVDGNGNFRFKKLDPNETYLFKVNDEEFDMDGSQLYAMENGHQRKLTKLPNSFAFYSLDLMSVTDSKLDVSKFQLEYEGEIPDSAQAYLYDEETNEIIETADIEEDGSFSFRQLDPEHKYMIKFAEEIDETQAKFFVIEEEDAELDVAAALEASQTIPTKKKEVVKPVVETITPEVEPVQEESIEEIVEVVEDQPTEEEVVEKELVAEEVIKDKTPPKPKEEKLTEIKGEWVVYFDFNEYMLNADQIDYLKKEVISTLKENESLVITVEGHTDNVGSEAVNMRMAHLRISNVVYHLEIRGIDESRTTIKPYGESSPVASNDTEEGRAKNRRVEIHIQKH